jgi:hypothetical protein
MKGPLPVDEEVGAARAARLGVPPATEPRRGQGKKMTRAPAALLLVAACFAPEAREGLPCSETGDCPPGQSCQAEICTSQVLFDAAPADAPPVDASPPDPPGPFTGIEPIPLTCPTAIGCVDVREPWLTADRTTILFSYAVNAVNGDQDIYAATRPKGEGPFPQAASVGGINSTLTEHSPFLSVDGARLWFARQDLSGGVEVRPYDEILASTRGAAFDVATPVDGGINTMLGDERSPQITADGTAMLFTRAPEAAPGDHDVYLAHQDGGQWNTIERLAELNIAGANERSVALVEERRTIFFIRDDQIHEAVWTGDDPRAIAVEVVHPELDAAPLDVKIGLWASADGTELWFDSNRSGAQQIYRAVRPAPTQSSARPWSSGRIRRRPIR